MNCGPWSDGTAFSALYLHYLRRGVTSTEHRDVDVLDDVHADLLDRLQRGVADDEGALDVVPVMVELLVQRGLQLQFSLREQEVLPDGGARLPALLGGSELHLPDGHVDTCLLSVHLLHDAPHVVLHPAGLPDLPEPGLEGDRGGGVGGEPEVEGEGGVLLNDW